MTVSDLLRLVAVPALAWAAWHDYRTRRVPADRYLWYPLVAAGVLAFLLDLATVSSFGVRPLLLRTLVSVTFMTALGYGFWWFGLFGGADRKAFVVLGVLFPTFPTYDVGAILPLVRTPLGILSLSIVTNAAVIGLAYPFALASRNALAGQFGPAMFLGRPVGWRDVPAEHGVLMETSDGLALDGLDLDALRMYLRWRGIALADVRGRADDLRDPDTLPDDPNPPTGGAVGDDDLVGDLRTDGGRDEWGAEAFLDSIDGPAYGTTPRTLREGLDVLASRDTVWVMSGIPFIVPLFVGTFVALVYGDVLFALFRIAGIV